MSLLRKKISPNVGAALDVARCLASFYVVLHHVASSRGWTHGFGTIFRFGQEAVIVFFILSGFVIYANENIRALNPYGYYLRRVRRIYPSLIVAIFISTAVAFDNGNLIEKFNLRQLIVTLASLQDISLLKPGVIADPYLGNDPLWSLSYEIAFYIIFPFVLRFWVRNKFTTSLIVGALSCLSYVFFALHPNHFLLVGSYFIIWWCGAMAADAYLRGEKNFKAFTPSLLWLSLICVVSALVVVIVGFKGVGYYPFLTFRHFSVSLIMLVTLSGKFGKFVVSLCKPFSNTAAFVASISYGIYVLHYPILINWNRAQSVFGLSCGVVLLVFLAYIADRQLNLRLPRAPRD
ncbi:MAG: acyltransferase [Novosphingobium aromaticivorans]|jgi:peptidoglycan/LPS O-acetylase OafA/YrhL|nr:acyltransferase [Novosphingobium aromaticivorans]